jgi:hypothetical protein
MIFKSFKFISQKNKYLIPLFFLFFGYLLLNSHNLFEESDGVFHYYSALEISKSYNYNNWASNFWPPLYPLLGSFFIPLFDGFFILKLISLLSGFVLLLTIFDIVYSLTLNYTSAFFSQLLTILFSCFIVSSIQAENHILDTCLILLGIKYLTKFTSYKSKASILLAGFFIALAGLTRYTSYAFVPGTVLYLFLVLQRRDYIYILYFLIAFIVPSCPWWLINFMNNGNPFHTWQYLNIGLASSGFEFGEWWWKESSNYNSIKDLILHFKLNYFFNFIKNIFKTVYITIINLNILLFYIFLNRNLIFVNLKLFLISLSFSFIIFILLVSQAFVFTEVFLTWFIIIIIIFSSLIKSNHYFIYFKFAFILFFIISFFKVKTYINDFSDGGQLSDNSLIIPIIKTQGDNLKNSYVMSIHPARAFYLGSNYLTIPLYYEGDISGLVSYKGIEQNVIKTIPTYPANILSNNPNIKADYLIFEQSSLKYLPQFKFLFDSNSLNIPSNFKLLYKSKSCVVYKIK